MIRDKKDCTYFDQRKPCSVCGARPAMRKTGKCAPHSVTPYDMGRVDDWIDCYKGCLKHDINAFNKWYDKQRNDRVTIKGKRVRISALNKAKEAAENTPIPTLDRLFTLHRQPVDKRDEYLGSILQKALDSRHISHIMVGAMFGFSKDTAGRKLRGQRQLAFFEVCELLDFLNDYDQGKYQEGYKKQ